MDAVLTAAAARSSFCKPSCLVLFTPSSGLHRLPRHPRASCGRSSLAKGSLKAERGLLSRAMAAPQSVAPGTLNDEELQSGSAKLIGKNDLLVVGPGVLGRIVAEQWKQIHQDCQIFGQTLTSDHHGELIELGINPILKGSQIGHFPYVIFCAPPYKNPEYAGEIRLAASSWSGEGSFVFTSSSATYDCSDNGLCDEDHPIVPLGRSPRTDVLLKAEKEALDAGGCVLRLAGLYKSDRGAHSYWLEKGTVDSRPDHIVNLIHYEDAAALSIAIMKKHLRGRIFLGCDNQPLSRQEIMDVVERSGKFSKKFQGFTGTTDPLERDWTTQKLAQK